MAAMKCLDCNARWYRMGPAFAGDCPDCGSVDIDLDTDPVEDDSEEDEPCHTPCPSCGLGILTHPPA